MSYKLLLKEIKQTNKWTGTEDQNPDEIKLGEVAFPFKGKNDDIEVDFKVGDKIYYQYGTKGVLNGEEYVLVSLSSLVKKYE